MGGRDTELILRPLLPTGESHLPMSDAYECMGTSAVSVYAIVALVCSVAHVPHILLDGEPLVPSVSEFCSAQL